MLNSILSARNVVACLAFGCAVISIVSAGDLVSDQFKRMQPCPSKPNCVSSEVESGSQSIAPLVSAGDGETLIEALKTYLEKDSAFSIIEVEAYYLRAEARTRILRFVDDVEFQVRPDSNQVDMRSGSRVGYSDLGKNRRRLEAIRKFLIERKLATS